MKKKHNQKKYEGELAKLIWCSSVAKIRVKKVHFHNVIKKKTEMPKLKPMLSTISNTEWFEGAP